MLKRLQTASELGTNVNGGVGDHPRPSTLKRPTLVTVGGISSAFILDSLDAFSFARGRCIACPPLPVDSLTWFSAVVANNTLIVTGGIRVCVIKRDYHRAVTLCESSAFKTG